jgi:mRNA-degrading endonuclease RelE of RelBE toxin-antitoxin system
MDNYFEIVFLKEAFEFLQSLELKHSNKILYNIRKSQQKHDPELFKKLTAKFGNSELCIKDFNIAF